MANVFVSYSRRDFHAAEALASVLAASGEVRAWLDVEHLRPGTDWSTAINGAIDSADAVVVVASPAAMTSRWVTEEWQRALRAGKQVHLALVRDTELPAELAPAVVHDLRGRFFTESRRLVDVLMGRATPRTRRRVPVSGPMALLWSALVFCTLVAGVGATLSWEISQMYQPVDTRMSRFALTLALVNAVGAAGLIYVMVRLARRTVSPWSLKEGLFAGVLITLLTFLGTLMMSGENLRDAAGPDPRSAAWLYLTATAVAQFGLVLVRVSRTVHLEMPTGAGEDHLRGRLRGERVTRRKAGRADHHWAVYLPRLAALKAATPGVGSIATYSVWCHDFADAPFANLISYCCDTAGFVQDDANPRWVFVVVSTRTPGEILRSALEMFGDRVVFVLATGLRIPDEDELRRHQWLDFREQDPEGLYDFLRAAVTADQAQRGVITVPLGVDTFRAPRYVTGYLLSGRMMIGFVAAPPLGMLLAGNLARAVPVVLVTGALVLAVINLMRGTATRSIDEVGWWARSVLVFLLFIAWLVLAPNIPRMPPIDRAVLFIVVTMGMFRPRKLLRHWLPPARKEPPTKPLVKPVTPSAKAFSLPLASLLLAAMSFFFAGI